MSLFHGLIGAAIAAIPVPQEPDARVTPETWDVLGLELPCGDAQRAAGFYEACFGYEVAVQSEHGASLRKGDVFLVLDVSRELDEEPPQSLIYLSYRVADLRAAAALVKASGGVLLDLDPQPFVLGHSMGFLDTEGNRGTLVRLTGETEPADRLPAVFNLSISTPLLEGLEQFLCTELKFEVYSRAYLPRTLPLKQRGSVMLVLHRSDRPAATSRQCGPSTAILMGVSAGGPLQRPAGTPGHSMLYGDASIAIGPGDIEIIGIRRSQRGSPFGEASSRR